MRGRRRRRTVSCRCFASAKDAAHTRTHKVVALTAASQHTHAPACTGAPRPPRAWKGRSARCRGPEEAAAPLPPPSAAASWGRARWRPPPPPWPHPRSTSTTTSSGTRPCPRRSRLRRPARPSRRWRRARCGSCWRPRPRPRRITSSRASTRVCRPPAATAAAQRPAYPAGAPTMRLAWGQRPPPPPPPHPAAAARAAPGRGVAAASAAGPLHGGRLEPAGASRCCLVGPSGASVDGGVGAAGRQAEAAAEQRPGHEQDRRRRAAAAGRRGVGRAGRRGRGRGPVAGGAVGGDGHRRRGRGRGLLEVRLTYFLIIDRLACLHASLSCVCVHMHAY